MYICYLDESGTAVKGDQSLNFVYAGLAIPAETWKAKDSNISQIKAAHHLDGEEIHTAWILRKYVEQVKIPDFELLSHEDRRKQIETLRLQELNRLELSGKTKNKKKEMVKFYRETSPYIHLTLQERNDFIGAICDCIRSWRDARIFFYAIKKDRYDLALNNVGGIYEDAFCQVVSRFQTFLQLTSTTSPKKIHGLLVSDNNESVQTKLTKLTRHFHNMGAFWRDIPNIVETPLFVDSKQTSMIQLADIVAYALRRYFDAGDEILFNKIMPRIDRHKGKVEGGRHFTPLESCQCRICRMTSFRQSRNRKKAPQDRA